MEIKKAGTQPSVKGPPSAGAARFYRQEDLS
jgi:hypothetical protein